MGVDDFFSPFSTDERRPRRRERVRERIRKFIEKRAHPADFIVSRDCPYILWLAGHAFSRRCISIDELDKIYWWCMAKQHPTTYEDPGQFPFVAETIQPGTRRHRMRL